MPVLRVLLAPLLFAAALTACERPAQTPPAPKLDPGRAGQPMPRTEVPTPPSATQDSQTPSR